MNDELQLEVVDLGDAKEETMGLPEGPQSEPNEVRPRKEID